MRLLFCIENCSLGALDSVSLVKCHVPLLSTAALRAGPREPRWDGFTPAALAWAKPVRLAAVRKGRSCSRCGPWALIQTGPSSPRCRTSSRHLSRRPLNEATAAPSPSALATAASPGLWPCTDPASPHRSLTPREPHTSPCFLKSAF